MLKRATKFVCMCVFALAVSSGVSYGQTFIPFNVGPKVTGGFKGGTAISSFTGDVVFQNSTLSARTGLSIGGFLNLDIPVLPFQIQAELLYTQKGAKNEVTDGNFEVDYIEVPILIKYPILKRARIIKPSVYAGPYLGFNIRATNKTGFVGRAVDQFVRNTTAGAAFGTEIDVRQLIFGARYSIGLTDVFESNAPPFTDEKNMVFSFYAGFKFN